MLKIERFLPGFNHIICGKPPKTPFAQFQQKLVDLRRSTLSELSFVFEGLIPSDKLSWAPAGAHSRNRIFTRSEPRALKKTTQTIPMIDVPQAGF